MFKKILTPLMMILLIAAVACCVFQQTQIRTLQAEVQEMQKYNSDMFDDFIKINGNFRNQTELHHDQIIALGESIKTIQNLTQENTDEIAAEKIIIETFTKDNLALAARVSGSVSLSLELTKSVQDCVASSSKNEFRIGKIEKNVGERFLPVKSLSEEINDLKSKQEIMRYQLDGVSNRLSNLKTDLYFSSQK